MKPCKTDACIGSLGTVHRVFFLRTHCTSAYLLAGLIQRLGLTLPERISLLSALTMNISMYEVQNQL